MYYKGYQSKKISRKKNKTPLYLIIVFLVTGIVLGIIFRSNIPFFMTGNYSFRSIKILIDEGNYLKAENKLEDMEKNKFDPLIFYYKGLIHYENNNFFDAVFEFRKAYTFFTLRNIPDEIILYIANSYYYQGVAFYPYAQRYYQLYRTLTSSNDEQILYRLAIVNTLLENFKEAEKYFLMIYENFKNTLEYLYYYGICLKNLGKYELAAYNLSIAAENTKDIDLKRQAVFQLGKTYYFSNDLDTSIQWFENLIELKPDSSMAYYYIGAIYLKKQHFARAQEALSKALLFDKNNEDAKNLLKKIHTGDYR